LDVVNAVNAQNLTLPSGFAKIGDTQYTVRTNAMPTTIADLKVLQIARAAAPPGLSINELFDQSSPRRSREYSARERSPNLVEGSKVQPQPPPK
jgi:hypothetical protein